MGCKRPARRHQWQKKKSPRSRASWRSRAPAIGFGWRGRLRDCRSPTWRRGTRITQRHLAAIEKSDFSELPGRTYVTGFARAYARAIDPPEAEIGAAVRRELEDDAYGARPLYEAYEPTDPARLPTARLTWTLVIVTLLLASAYGVWRFLSVEPDEALIAAQNRAADASEAPQGEVAAVPATKAGSSAAAVAANAPVVLTAVSEVWIGFDDAQGKTENWRTLDAGETYQVPPAYTEQFTLRTSIPQALKVTVGGRDIGSVGPAGYAGQGLLAQTRRPHGPR